MKKQVVGRGLDSDKLLENALASIRLGIEDYETANNGDDPARSLSSIRNLLSGILLLFKYKIAVTAKTPNDAASLIYNIKDVIPTFDENGAVIWSLDLKSTSLDVDSLIKRLEQFSIRLDWTVLKKIRDRRNELEHLHPSDTLGELTTLVAEVFPLLRDFIEQYLNKTPSELLGNTWSIMLDLNTFFEDTRLKCIENWSKKDIPALLIPYLNKSYCEYCGSLLITPSPESLAKNFTISQNEDEFKYSCLGCNHSDLIVPVLINALNEATPYNPFNGDEPIIQDCNNCNYEAFNIQEGVCYWCGYQLTYSECGKCGSSLSQDEQDLGGLCSYHANEAYKND
ncbi:Uncharacterised protein [Yersinia enterocolitica]|uniref:hypothetical protein n=1 Tax=Yersinia enterocolitica TaxID=630 RepID=UPI0005E4BE37|nr:hypothetical protein [Yersinia enterocolitica]ELW7363038.1 hypothetical protein [Yersinia enterocolitica]CNE91503.1 Uncharacterised protein [Yersinia enterocolitica]